LTNGKIYLREKELMRLYSFTTLDDFDYFVNSPFIDSFIELTFTNVIGVATHSKN